MKRTVSRSEAQSQTNEKRPGRKSRLPDAQLLLDWYDRNRRILPWRARSGEIADPYHVWISEIMLQQTTVATVGPYYRAFITRWPRFADLAAADVGEVMKRWAGLGYYSRARMLHKCAAVLVDRHKGLMPEEEDALLALPGIGPYTAAAIRAIAFDKRANVVDGNVERVVARVFAVETPLPSAKPALRRLAATLLPTARWGDYAQALMDLGATICTVRRPKCLLCPWNKTCLGFKKGVAESLPRRASRAVKPVRRAIAFVLTKKDGSILLRRREARGLLGGMMEVPTSEWFKGEMPDLETVLGQAPVKADWRLIPAIVQHGFTHFDLEIQLAVAQGGKKRRLVIGLRLPTCPARHYQALCVRLSKPRRMQEICEVSVFSIFDRLPVMRGLSVLLFVLFLTGTAHPAAAEVYIRPTLLNLVHTLVRYGAVDLNDNEVIDNYAMLAECDLFIRYSHDDFKWHDIQRLLRQKLTDDIPTYPTSYYVDMKMQLGHYDFDEKMYRFMGASTPKNANSFVIEDNGATCGMHTVAIWPLAYRLVLDKSVTIAGLPFFEDDAKLLLKRMDASGNLDHIIYSRWNLRVFSVPPYVRARSIVKKEITGPLAIEGSNQNIQASLGSVEFYEDAAMKKLIYVYRQ